MKNSSHDRGEAYVSAGEYDKAYFMKDWNLSLEPRKYQGDALEYALGAQKSVCCLPTGTGKTLVGALWLQRLNENEAICRALILEPTRLLVKQVALYYMDKIGIEVQTIDGSIPPQLRERLWEEALVVATPECAFNDRDWLNFDAVIVDECHHTVGQDAFAKLMDNISFSYRLGLSATIPEKRRPEVEKYIGRIRQWHWSDPEIETYMPDWIGEVYEADLDESESEALGVIRSLPSSGFAAGLLERYLSRDGTLALAETLQKQGKLGKRFGPAILPLLQDNPDRMHKFQVLKQLLNDHDFRKAIVFVERRTVAVHLAEQFKSLNPVLFLGCGKVDQEQALKQVKLPETRLIIATSAGEEGIDLPEADLLVAWGSVTSEIRFIQRHGRIMRKVGNGLKFATFIVTPGSSDFDSFVKGLERAQASGQINIEEAFGWEPSILWPKTTWWHVTESLRGQGQPLKTIGETLGVREQVAYRVIQGAIKRGRIFYIYDVANIATSIARWYLTWYARFPDIRPIAPRLSSLAKEFSDSPSPLVLSRAIAALLASCPPEIAGSLVKRLRPKFSKFSPKVLNGANTAGDKSKGERISRQRIYRLSEDAQHVAQFLPNQLASYEKFSEEPSVNIIIPMRKTKKGGLDKRILSGLWLYGESVKGGPEQFWETSIRAEWDDDTPGYTIGFRSPTLEYYFLPRTAEVFAATIDNMCGLLRWRDILTVALNKCSRCGSHGAWACPHCSEVLCANCWESEAGYGRLCWQLEEFGKPVMKEVY